MTITRRIERLADGVTLYLGDCREILPTLGKVDAAIVDPPYGETSLGWDRRVIGWPTLLLPLIKAPGSMWVFGSQRMFLECANEFGGWKFSHDVVWEKHNGTGLFNDRFRRVHELALHFYPARSAWARIYKEPQFANDATARTIRKKGRPAQWIGAAGETTYVSEDGGPRLQRSVIYARSEHGNAEHPTQKPPAIIEPLLRYACPPEGIVLDPMMGSGSIGVVARRTGRQFVGIEADAKYFDVACRRIDDVLRAPDLFIERPKPAEQRKLEL
jgi:site-specific DNA-methyltransferase (adenine-specific)